MESMNVFSNKILEKFLEEISDGVPGEILQNIFNGFPKKPCNEFLKKLSNTWKKSDESHGWILGEIQSLP